MSEKNDLFSTIKRNTTSNDIVTVIMLGPFQNM